MIKVKWVELEVSSRGSLGVVNRSTGPWLGSSVEGVPIQTFSGIPSIVYSLFPFEYLPAPQ